MAQNEGLIEKALRYGNAFLFKGGLVGIGKEAAADIKQRENRELADALDEAFYTNKNYRQAFNISDFILDKDDVNEGLLRFALYMKALSCFYIAEEETDNDFYNQSRSLFFEYGNTYGWEEEVIYVIMLIDNALGYKVNVRNEAIVLMNSNNNDFRKEATELYNIYTNEILDCSFTEEVDYGERKYIYIGQNVQKIGGTYQWYDDERVVDWIFTLDKIPTDIVFPLGRPQPGLYIAHPIKTDHYYPMEKVEETLFMEKVNEFCWLVQCLGATEVSFHSNKGLSVSKGMGSSNNVEGSVGIEEVTVGGGYGKTQKRDQSNNSNKQVELVQHFTPKKQAYCPSDLEWIDSDRRWQTLVKQRLNGGMLDYNYKITSSETCQISTNEMDELKANFTYIMANVNANYNSSTDQTFAHTEETEWSIHVDFAPLEDLTDEPSSNNNILNNEQEYLDVLQEVMGDGEISNREQKMLNKIREKLGISQERANELKLVLTSPKQQMSGYHASNATTSMIDCFVNYLSDILLNVNLGDNMYPRISSKVQLKLTYKFGLRRNEAILLYRDSGFLFTKYTMVMTDKGIYYRDDNKKVRTFTWQDVLKVQCESVGDPNIIDFHFITSRQDYAILMTEFGIINKEEIDKYLEPIRKGFVLMAKTAKNDDR